MGTILALGTLAKGRFSYPLYLLQQAVPCFGSSCSVPASDVCQLPYHLQTMPSKRAVAAPSPAAAPAAALADSPAEVESHAASSAAAHAPSTPTRPAQSLASEEAKLAEAPATPSPLKRRLLELAEQRKAQARGRGVKMVKFVLEGELVAFCVEGSHALDVIAV